MGDDTQKAPFSIAVENRAVVSYLAEETPLHTDKIRLMQP